MTAYCPRCHAVIDPADTFCGRCGQRQGPPGSVPGWPTGSPQPHQPSFGTGLGQGMGIGMGCVLFILLVVVGIPVLLVVLGAMTRR